MWSKAIKLARGTVDASRLAGAPRGDPAELTWPVSESDRSRIVVLWPRSYEWPNAAQWVLPIRHGMARLVNVVEDDIPQRHQGVVVIRLRLDDVLHDVVLDYADTMEYDERLLDAVSLYFKMQCPRDADERIVPGGFVPRSEQIYTYIRRLRRTRAQRDFSFDVHGRFGLGSSVAIRSQAVKLLTEQDRFRYEGGLALVAYPTFLREIAKSAVCIDLPGHGPLCYRLMDYLAVGACVIGPRPPVVLPVPLSDQREIVYTRDDLSDLVELCEHYLTDDTARERVATEAQQYFDRYIDRNQLGSYYLHTALRRLQ